MPELTKHWNLRLDDVGLFISADLSGTEEGRRLYEEIKGGYRYRQNVVSPLLFLIRIRPIYTHGTITGIKRLYDVAAVDIPAYETSIRIIRLLKEARGNAEDWETLDC